MRKIIVQILLIIAIITAISVQAQLPQIYNNMMSPNVATLGQYGKIPVSSFTGVPQIEIPIYEFTVAGRKIPITMSYHSTGIRPDQRPGWLGIGWNLMAGGYISRATHGATDEYNPKAFHDNTAHNSYHGYFYHSRDLGASNWNTAKFMNDYINKHKGYLQVYDCEPDEFNFNFLGYSGSFYLNPEREWIVKCDEKIAIDNVKIGKAPIENKAGLQDLISEVILGFTLKSDDGTKYIFGYDPNAIELAIPFFDQNNSDWVSSSWQLTEIIYPNGDKVKLTYERSDFTNQLWYSLYNINFGVEDSGLISYECAVILDTTNKDAFVTGNLIYPSYLKSIEFPTGKINFESRQSQQLKYSTKSYELHYTEGTYNAVYFFLVHGVNKSDKTLKYNDIFKQRLQTRQLDKIIIEDSNGKKIKSTNFTFENNGKNRLFLKEVNNQNIEKYKFEYFKWDSMPGLLSDKTDHWGYFNKIEAGIKNDNVAYFNAREPNEETMGYGVISKIIYPTGGYTRFEFEPHRCGAILNSQRTSLIPANNKLVGGVRIKKIINSANGNGQDEIVDKEFFYVKDFARNKGIGGLSSGIIGGLPQYYFSNFEMSSPFGSNKKGYLNILCSHNSFFTGGNNSNGSHIGYSEVTEKLSDGSFNVYKYSNFDTKLDDPAEVLLQGTRTENAKYSSREQDRGLLLEHNQYNNSYEITCHKEFEYSNSSNSYVPALYLSIMSSCDIDFPFIEAASYKIYVYTPKKIRETEEIFYNNGKIKNSQSIIYNKYWQPKTITRTTNNGDSIRTSYSYLWELNSYAISDHVLSPVTNIISTYINKRSNSENQISHFNYYYNRLDGANYVPMTEIKKSQGLIASADTTKCEYDDTGHLIFRERGGKDGTVYLWGYKSQFIVATIKNATVKEVRNIVGNLNKFADDAVPNFARIAKLREALPNAFITSCTYLPLIGMTSKTNPNGATEYYRYDISGKLKYVSDDKGNILKVFSYDFKQR